MRFVEDDKIKQTFDLGNDLKLHVVCDGQSTDGTQFRFEHPCKPRLGDNGERIDVTCAPGLQPGHIPSWNEGRVTISPSILCPDCNTHGFIHDGKWSDA